VELPITRRPDGYLRRPPGSSSWRFRRNFGRSGQRGRRACPSRSRWQRSAGRGLAGLRVPRGGARAMVSPARPGGPERARAPGGEPGQPGEAAESGAGAGPSADPEPGRRGYFRDAAGRQGARSVPAPHCPSRPSPARLPASDDRFVTDRNTGNSRVKLAEKSTRCVTAHVPGILCLRRGRRDRRPGPGAGRHGRPPRSPARRPVRLAATGLPAKVRDVRPGPCTCRCKVRRRVLRGVGGRPGTPPAGPLRSC
jgi:hypothetical protein